MSALLNNKKVWIQLSLLVAGLSLVAVLVVQSDVGSLGENLQSIGWFILPITLFHLIPLFLHTLGWRQLLQHDARTNYLRLYVLRWITESVNNLLPVAQIGGEFVRARLFIKIGVTGATASSTVLADFTVGLLAQALFTLIGVVLLFAVTGANDFVTQIATGIVVFLMLLIGFLYFQSQGLSKIASFMVTRSTNNNRWQTLIENTEQFTNKVKQLYSQRRIVFLAFCCRLLAWFAGVGETFLILNALDISVPLSHLVILESFAFAARSLGFLIPGAVGITEGALVLVGTLLGLTPAHALTLALAKRARELLLGIPGLLTWVIQESATGNKHGLSRGTDK